MDSSPPFASSIASKNCLELLAFGWLAVGILATAFCYTGILLGSFLDPLLAVMIFADLLPGAAEAD
jgi:hypothetical protein